MNVEKTKQEIDRLMQETSKLVFQLGDITWGYEKRRRSLVDEISELVFKRNKLTEKLPKQQTTTPEVKK